MSEPGRTQRSLFEHSSNNNNDQTEMLSVSIINNAFYAEQQGHPDTGLYSRNLPGPDHFNPGSLLGICLVDIYK